MIKIGARSMLYAYTLSHEILATTNFGQFQKFAKISCRQNCWLYNIVITSNLYWDLTTYNRPITFMCDLGAVCTRYLKM